MGMRKYMRDVARARIIVKGGNNGAMRRMWRSFLKGDNAEAAEIAQASHGRIERKKTQAHRMANERMLRIRREKMLKKMEESHE